MKKNRASLLENWTIVEELFCFAHCLYGSMGPCLFHSLELCEGMSSPTHLQTSFVSLAHGLNLRSLNQVLNLTYHCITLSSSNLYIA